MQAYFDRFTITMTKKQAQACSHPGPCDSDVEETIPALHLKLDPQAVREELQGFGAWDETELQDDAENLRRIVWIAAGNICEETRGG